MVERVALAGALLMAAGPASATAQTRPEELADKSAFEKVCGACHAANMVTDPRAEPDWIETVDHMVSIGAKGTDDQFDRVMRYLARNLTIVNINTATAAQLAPVLGVGEAVAQAVVGYRSKHGSFRTLDDLKKVPGLDAGLVDARKKRIVF